MRYILSISLICAMSLISHLSIAQSAQIIYVKKGATGSANGTSWTNAYPELRTALTAAVSISGSKEIWVAQGEYKPTDNIDRTKTFLLPSQTRLYGGFAGNESSLSARNWKQNRTVLSGDLGIQFDKIDNSYHVVTAKDVDANSGLDGFIVKEGSVVEDGVLSYGGGILIGSSGGITSPKINNCQFVNNRASAGGALATVSDTGSNGIVAPEITNCHFDGNLGTSVGGAISISNSSSDDLNFTTFVNCSFSSNRAGTHGGAGSIASKASFVNCTMTFNKSSGSGTALYSAAYLTVENSIIWKNFDGTVNSPDYSRQIYGGSTSTLIVRNNIIQGGFGLESDKNIDVDPLFLKEPSSVGVYPRTSIIPTQTTDPKYENQLETFGSRMPNPWTYYTYMDHQYNKLYITGSTLEIIDFNNLTNGLPTSSYHYPEFYFGRISRIEDGIHESGNKIYLETGYEGMKTIDRATGAISTVLPILQGEGLTFDYYNAEDIYIDNENNLLYSPIFYSPGNVFYGLLEWNLTTNVKRWINQLSTPVSIPQVNNAGDDGYWNGHRLYMDEVANTLYYSMGNGIWWWNRNNNTTGIYNTQGGIPLAPGNQNLPSNLTTSMYIDHTENKFYIGTHNGLFVWDRNNNTSRIYNTTNSKMINNLVDHVDKSDSEHLVFIACEYGGLFTINTQTGEERIYKKDEGNEVYPQLVDTDVSSGNFDEVDKKLYVSAWNPQGGVWVKDYNNLIPDYGDLSLKPGSPAIDRGDNSFLPGSITIDIDGQNRLVDYTSLFGSNSLDLGAYEKTYEAEDEAPQAIPENLSLNYVLSFNALTEGITNESLLDNYPVQDVNRSIQYIDGLGRPMQSIAIQGSPSRLDVIQPIIYDEFGREAVKYLPFTNGNDGLYKYDAVGTNSPQLNFYTTDGTPTIDADQAPFSQTVFEPSPLNRPDKEYGPGQDWATTGANKFVQHQYLTNQHSLSESTTEESVIAWKVDASGDPVSEEPVTGYIEEGGYYSSNQLHVKVTIDEQGHTVREYTNKEGQVILKKVQVVEGSANLNDAEHWACTYYIYDDLNNLVFVLPPEGVKQFLLTQD